MTAVVEPSDDRYNLIIDELKMSKHRLESLRLLADLEAQPAPEGSGRKNLLEVRYPPAKNRQIPRGVKLAKEIAEFESVVAFFERALDEYNAQVDAFHASQPKAQPEVGA